MDLDTAQELALELLDRYGLEGWTFGFDGARCRFGCCDYSARRITLSRGLTALNPEQEVVKTLLHEIAHALVGPGHGHDAVWRACDLRLGGDGQRCVDARVTVALAPYVSVCATCGVQTPVFRRRRAACRKCCDAFANGKFDRRFLLGYLRNKPVAVAEPPLSSVGVAADALDGAGLHLVANQQALSDLPTKRSRSRFLEEALTFIRGCDARSGDCAYQIGTKLLEVKQQLNHGEYEAFLQVELGYKLSTARLYTRLANAPDGPQLAQFGIGIAGLLLVLPEDQRAFVLADPKTATMSYRDIQEWVRELRGRQPARPAAPVALTLPESTEFAWAAGIYQLLPTEVTEERMRDREGVLRQCFDPASGFVSDATLLQQLHRAREILTAALFARKEAA